MAQRRMFSRKITNTDDFIEMPHSTQCLYFHFVMEADDEGFIGSPKRIVRSIGCSEDDYNKLLEKKYIIGFDTGICVVRHWRIHNYVASDRFNNTIYNKEKDELIVFNSVYDISSNRKDGQKETKEVSIPYKEIIEYLNSVCNTDFRCSSTKTKDLIQARFNEGYNLNDFKTVIDIKSKDTFFIENGFLRPSTLFSNKFESYLNEKPKKNKLSKVNIDLGDILDN